MTDTSVITSLSFAEIRVKKFFCLAARLLSVTDKGRHFERYALKREILENNGEKKAEI